MNKACYVVCNLIDEHNCSSCAPIYCEMIDPGLTMTFIGVEPVVRVYPYNLKVVGDCINKVRKTELFKITQTTFK